MVHDDCRKMFEGSIKPCQGTSWNEKDKTGKTLADAAIASLVILVLSTLLLSVSGHGKRKAARKLAIVGYVVAAIVILIIIIDIALSPIHVLYAASQYATRLKETPAVMSPYDTPVAVELENNFEIILQEVKEMLRQTTGTLAKYTYGGQNQSIGSDTRIQDGRDIGWEITNIHMGNHFNALAEEIMPTFVDLMKKHKVLASVLSVLPGKTKIPPHYGYSSFVKRLMLGVTIPSDRENCYLCVNGEKQVWEEGKTMLWDDTYPHAVYNESTEDRVVIYMDILRITGDPIVDSVGTYLLNLLEKTSIIRTEVARTERKESIS
jgi:ornithine lipid ester-linked acyl 2-hydroxylase